MVVRVSRFNCNDCVKFGTDACKFGVTHGDYSDYCKEMLVEQDHAYNKAIDDIKPMLKNLEGSIYWYDSFSIKLESMKKGKKNE